MSSTKGTTQGTMAVASVKTRGILFQLMAKVSRRHMVVLILSMTMILAVYLQGGRENDHVGDVILFNTMCSLKHVASAKNISPSQEELVPVTSGKRRLTPDL